MPVFVDTHGCLYQDDKARSVSDSMLPYPSPELLSVLNTTPMQQPDVQIAVDAIRNSNDVFTPDAPDLAPENLIVSDPVVSVTPMPIVMTSTIVASPEPPTLSAS